MPPPDVTARIRSLDAEQAASIRRDVCLTKILSREASSWLRRRARLTSCSCPFHLRTLPATITVSTLVRSISETTAPGTWLSGATLSAVASRMMMSASLPGCERADLAVEPQCLGAVHGGVAQHVARCQEGGMPGAVSATYRRG